MNEQAITQMSESEFLKSQSLDDFNEVIEFDRFPVTLKEKIIKQAKIAKIYNYFSYTCWDYKLKQFVKHTFAVRLHSKRKTGEITSCDVQEVRRDFETYPTIFRNMYYVDYGCAKGCHTIWNTKTVAYQTVEFDNNWYLFSDDEYYHKRMAYYTYEINFIENIIASDLSLRYMGYQKNPWIDLIDYIKLYRKEPIVETFMKLNLYRFIENEKAIKTTNENKAFRKWLYRNYEDCKGKAFTTCYNSFKKNPNNSVQNYYNSLIYRIECGKELAKAGKEIYEYTIKFVTRERIRDYLEENNIGGSSYFDYLTACRWLQLDFNDTKVLFPRDFKTYHDDYTRQYGEWKLEQEKKQSKIEYAEISEKMNITASQFEYCNFKGNEFSIIVAKNKMELIEEGSKLHHCVGRMNYDKNQAEGESLICFVRRNNELDTPFATIQLNLNKFEIMQCYAIYNSKPSNDVMEFINNTWLPTIKKLKKQVAATI